jgi:predicted permease
LAVSLLLSQNTAEAPVRGLSQDVRYAIRILQKNPGFTFIAALTIALGIGANSAIFSVINSILLRPLPFTEPHRLVRVFSVLPAFPHFPFNPLDFIDFRRENHVFEHLAVYLRNDLQLAEGGQPERLSGLRVSAGYFECLGVRPQLGGTFKESDETSEAEHTVILSDRLWRRRFSADREIVGRAVRLSGELYTVRGVMPPGLHHIGGTYRSLPYGEDVDVWWPLALSRAGTNRGSHFLNAIARLRPGVSMEQAAADMTTIAYNIGRLDPNNKHNRVEVVPLEREVVGKTERTLLVLLVAVGLVLLIACANVANLLLARAASRSREVAVRAALGASTGRLMAQMLTESVILALLGGVLGVVFASWGLAGLLAFRPDNLPRAHEISIDARVFGFAFAATVISGFLFGLAPAWRVRRTDLNDTLKQGGRGGSTGLSQSRAGSTLVVAEVALAFVLLTGTGLLLRTFINIQRTQPGFRADHVVTLALSLPNSRYGKEGAAGGFYGHLVERIRRIPGVQAAGAGSDLPWTGYDDNTSFNIEGRPTREEDAPHARYHFQTSGFVPALGIAVVSGRDIADSDLEKGAPVILINQALARKFFPGEQAVGKVLDLWGKRRTIIGIIGDVKDSPVAAEAEPAFYFPESQVASAELFLTVRHAPGVNVVPAVMAEIRKMDRELAASDIRPLSEIAAAAVSLQRFTLLLVGVFGALAVSLAGIGIFGVMSYSVAQRTHDIGVQMALGASPTNVLKAILTNGLKVASTGVLIGVAGAIVATRAMESLLYGVAARDALTLIAVALLLITVALIAAYLPARRAMSVDPSVALRQD